MPMALHPYTTTLSVLSALSKGRAEWWEPGGGVADW